MANDSVLPELLQCPDPRLRQISEPVTQFDGELERILSDLVRLLYHHNGVGFAAPQMNVFKRVVVVDASHDQSRLLQCVNPEILSKKGRQASKEGCFSLSGGGYEDVERAMHITLRAQNAKGEWFEHSAEGLEAACLQHEIDHLNGILFIDHLSELKRQRVLNRMKKDRS